MPAFRDILLFSAEEPFPKKVHALSEKTLVHTTSLFEDATRLFDSRRFIAVLIDMRSAVSDALQLLEFFQTRPSFTVFGALLSENEKPQAILHKVGVEIFQTKTTDWLSYLKSLEHIADCNLNLRQHEFDEEHILVGASQATRALASELKILAELKQNIWISGSKGSGKTHIARILAHLSQHKYITIDSQNTESKWHQINVADKKTIIVENLDEFSIENRNQLFSLLNEKHQIITTCHQDFEIWSQQNNTMDLPQKIAQRKIRILPLSERQLDIAPLIEYFLKTDPEGQKIVRLTDDTLAALIDYDWPGQVQELWDVLRECANNAVLRAQFLPQKILRHTFYRRDIAELAHLNYADAKKKAVSDFNRKYLAEILRRSDYNITVAAEKAGMDRSNFKKILRQYQLDED